ncbi:hypothetical protein JS528_02605 [Bifidobacterium sp. MA2]|uniref:Uncharacterized protein n=1 Tax=Bifidobacterium santillanense TaxID=2809028 RepID=A0ABS5UMZ2_9BIFI|nr:hypothetical protein [Bifidobacterium santillanense]MBT1172269.1 hypothetical protein [Bifidobacterium santillanense]
MCSWIGYLLGVMVLTLGTHWTGGMSEAEQLHLPLGRYTWFALWCLLGCTIPLFVRLSRGYPRTFVVLSVTICVLAWLSIGMRYAPIERIGPLGIPDIEWISDALNVVSLLVLGVSAWRAPRNGDPH